MQNDLFVYQSQKILQTKYTVDWLVNNTDVKIFDPISFTGYQRKIDSSHVDKLVDYLYGNEFFLPSAIICSSDEDCDSTHFSKLHIVDGQHRVEAFRAISKKDRKKYEDIKDYEIPVIILVKPDETIEINTFITINKTSKKVDTSLAFVLKNMKNRSVIAEEDLDIPHREFLAVEVARKLNDENKYELWNNRILYEGSARNSYEYISLNAFVKSLRGYLNELHKRKIIDIHWNAETGKEKIEDIVKKVSDLIEYTWIVVYSKYPELQNNMDDRRIIQGAIGFTTINRFLVTKLRESGYTFDSLDEYKTFISLKIMNEMNSSVDRWKQGGMYSHFSSESGYRAILKDMLSIS